MSTLTSFKLPKKIDLISLKISSISLGYYFILLICVLSFLKLSAVMHFFIYIKISSVYFILTALSGFDIPYFNVFKLLYNILDDDYLVLLVP
jgi:hypothetical protein